MTLPDLTKDPAEPMLIPPYITALQKLGEDWDDSKFDAIDPTPKLKQLIPATELHKSSWSNFMNHLHTQTANSVGIPHGRSIPAHEEGNCFCACLDCQDMRDTVTTNYASRIQPTEVKAFLNQPTYNRLRPQPQNTMNNETILKELEELNADITERKAAITDLVNSPISAKPTKLTALEAEELKLCTQLDKLRDKIYSQNQAWIIAQNKERAIRQNQLATMHDGIILKTQQFNSIKTYL